MPLTITFDDAAVLEGLAALQDASIRLAAHRAILLAHVRGKVVVLQGGFKGTVLAVGTGKVTLQDEKGVKRDVPLTPARAKQLMEGSMTHGSMTHGSTHNSRPKSPKTSRPHTADTTRK